MAYNGVLQLLGQFIPFSTPLGNFRILISDSFRYFRGIMTYYILQVFCFKLMDNEKLLIRNSTKYVEISSVVLVE